MRQAKEHLNQTSHGWFAAVVVALAAWALQIGALVSPGPSGPAAFDEQIFHLVTIEAFADQWPRPDISSYNVASAPGYHLVMSAVMRVFDPPLDVMRLLSGQAAVLLVAMVAWWTARRLGKGWGVLSGLVLLLAEGVATQTVLLLPEASAWLLVWLVVLAALSGRLSTRVLVALSAALAALVFIRQVHLWAASAVWLTAWLGVRRTGEEPSVSLIPPRSSWSIASRIPRTLVAFVVTVPAFAVVGWLFWLWGGPVPPGFQEPDHVPAGSVHSGGNPATPALVFGAFGMLGPLVLTPVVDMLRVRADLRRGAWVLGLVGAGLGLASALLVPTVEDKAAGRWTGLWTLTPHFPAIADRSLIIAFLATVGGAAVGLGLGVLRSRDRVILAGVLVAFTTAQSANQQAWIRYVEPMVVLSLLAIATLAAQRCRLRPAGWAILGPMAAILFLGWRSVPDLLGLNL